MRNIPLWNFPAFDRNTAFLRDHGWDVISPADLDREIGFDENDETRVFTESDFHEAMIRDYRALLDSDAIAFIPGWEKSTGAALERAFASKLRLPMYRVDADREYLERELIVGVAGVARAGKDTLAEGLVKEHQFERRSLADPLKGILYELNPLVDYDVDYDVPIRVQHLVDAEGWEGAKSTPEIRSLLQRLGTEGGRKHIADDIWSRTLFEKPHAARLVIPDIRFPNEAKAVQDRGGVIIRVERDGYAPVNAHISEVAYTDHDILLKNDGTPEDLRDSAVEALRGRGYSL